MFDFNFYNPTRIVFGRERLGSLDSYVPADARVLITYGGGSAKRSGLIDKVRANLSGRAVHEFGGIEPNPRFETLMKATEVVRSERIDFIVAVGGGSVIDGTKFITLAAHYAGEATELLQHGFGGVPALNHVVPFAAVLTLPATGSEMNNAAVISWAKGKFVVISDQAFPQFSILDASLTFSLPRVQVANGLIDAFVHTTEQYITFPVDALMQDRMAEGLMLSLIEVAQTTLNEPDNYAARANQVWCATLAVNGLIGAGVPQDWATHMIGHEITALLGIDHGQTLAVVLPALLEERREAKRAKLVQYAERVWGLSQGSDDAKIDAAIKHTRDFFESLGVKTRLSQYGATAATIDEIVDQLEEHGMTALSETQDITLAISRRILERAL